MWLANPFVGVVSTWFWFGVSWLASRSRLSGWQRPSGMRLAGLLEGTAWRFMGSYK